MQALAPALFSLLVPMLAACSSNPEIDAGASPRGAQLKASAQSRTHAGLRSAILTSGHGDYTDYPATTRLIDKLVREEGFDRDYLARVFAGVERQQWILDFVNRPRGGKSSGPTGAWSRYRAKFLTQDNISNGVAFWRRHESALRRAQAEYGVPPEYIVAILGVETHYGGYTGKHRVIDALATLAFDYPRRSDYFTGELEQFLIMSRDEGIDPFQPKGSYAGAMGLGQFMPTSFHKWAVDFDSNGKRDLWDPEDAIGSVANYFASFGWHKGEPVAVLARSTGSGAGAMKAGFDTSYSLDTLGRNGVLTTADLDGHGPVRLIELDARGGYEYWLGLKNFYVITRYNHSNYYAMAVHQLAQTLRSRYGAARPVLTQADPTGRESML
jgi:membrane-bound lytic murein transglycosylase B